MAKSTETDMQLPSQYSDLQGRRLLVTGAAGFIGGDLFRRLAAYGLDVTGTVLYPREAESLRSQGYQSEVLDLSTDESWDELISGFDVVFHIAAMFQEVEHGEDLYDKVNHRGALKLATTASRVGVQRFVHCSTVGVHGHVLEIPASEETAFNPMDLYHRTKLDGELAIMDFAASLPGDGMTVTVNRPAMVYGPGDTRMLKLFKAVLSKRFVMIGSGEVLTHLGFIEDQTESFLLCATAPRQEVHGEAFNIASDEPVTLQEVVNLIADEGAVKRPMLKVPVAPVWLAAWLCEVVCKPLKVKPPLFRRRVGFFTHDRAFDLTKAQTRLGYRSAWAHRDGIRRTIRWYRDNELV